MYEEHRLFLLQTDFTLSELLAHTQNSIASHVFTLPTALWWEELILHWEFQLQHWERGGKFEVLSSCCHSNSVLQSRSLPSFPTAHGLLFSHWVISNSLWPHGLQRLVFLVLHHLPEFAQTLVHWVGDAISHPLSSFSPPAFNFP